MVFHPRRRSVQKVLVEFFMRISIKSIPRLMIVCKLYPNSVSNNLVQLDCENIKLRIHLDLSTFDLNVQDPQNIRSVYISSSAILF